MIHDGQKIHEKHQDENVIAELEKEMKSMKSYRVYVYGEFVTTIKAGSHNAAEKKAYKMFPEDAPTKIQVEYTEV